MSPPLDRRLSRNADLICLLAGSLVFVLAVLLVLGAIAGIEVDRVRDGHVAQAQVITRMLNEADGVLDDLGRNRIEPCSSAGLAVLSQKLFFHRFIREIGVMEEGHWRLICTTSQGRLTQPIQFEPPAYRLPNGIGIDFDVPVLIGGGKLVAIVLSKGGRFNVVLDPHLTKDLYESVSALWLKQSPGLVPLHFREADRESMALYANAATEFDRGRRFIINSHWGFDLFTAVEGSGVVLHSSTGFAQIVRRNWLWLLAGGFVASILGALANAATRYRLALLSDMRQRIRALCCEQNLLCLYQPIVDLRDESIVGCEVLMRIRDGAEILTPDVTLPAIQHSGLQWNLDEMVTRKALTELASALPPVAQFKIALNFFPENVRFERISTLLQPLLTKLDRSDLTLCVEVTEHGFEPDVIEQSRRLKEVGFLVSVDDFGTGYSNLNIVKRVAPHFLKIDKSFVFEMEDATIKSSLIPEIVGIARAVGAETIAEGIENETQVTRLRELGVCFGQGYYFGRPEPLNAFVDRIRSRTELQAFDHEPQVEGLVA